MKIEKKRVSKKEKESPNKLNILFFLLFGRWMDSFFLFFIVFF
jgi:hypothetical protein